MFTLQTTLPILVIVLALFGVLYRFAFKPWASSRHERRQRRQEAAAA